MQLNPLSTPLLPLSECTRTPISPSFFTPSLLLVAPRSNPLVHPPPSTPMIFLNDYSSQTLYFSKTKKYNINAKHLVIMNIQLICNEYVIFSIKIRSQKLRNNRCGDWRHIYLLHISSDFKSYINKIKWDGSSGMLLLADECFASSC